MDQLLLQIYKSNAKPNSVPASVKNDLISYSFINHSKWQNISKFKPYLITSENIEKNISEILDQDIFFVSQNKKNVGSQPKDNIKNIKETQFWLKNKNIEYSYLKSLLRKQYELDIFYADRLKINKIIESYFLSLYCIISDPQYFMTPEGIKIRLHYYSGFNSIRTVSNWKYYKREHLSVRRWKLMQARKFKYLNRGIDRRFFGRLLKKGKNKRLYNYKLQNFLQLILNHSLKPQPNKDLNKKLWDKEYLKLNKYISAQDENYVHLGNSQDRNKDISNRKKYFLKIQAQKLCLILNYIFNTKIELELIEIHYPYHNSDILAKWISKHSKRKKFFNLTRKVLNRAKFHRRNNYVYFSRNKHKKYCLPYELTGLQMKLSGRWIRERTKPKKTMQLLQIGALTTIHKSHVTSSMATRKNKKGAFTVAILMTNTNVNYRDKDKRSEIYIEREKLRGQKIDLDAKILKIKQNCKFN